MSLSLIVVPAPCSRQIREKLASSVADLPDAVPTLVGRGDVHRLRRRRLGGVAGTLTDELLHPLLVRLLRHLLLERGDLGSESVGRALSTTLLGVLGGLRLGFVSLALGLLESLDAVLVVEELPPLVLVLLLELGDLLALLALTLVQGENHRGEVFHLAAQFADLVAAVVLRRDRRRLGNRGGVDRGIDRAGVAGDGERLLLVVLRDVVDHEADEEGCDQTTQDPPEPVVRLLVLLGLGRVVVIVTVLLLVVHELELGGELVDALVLGEEERGDLVVVLLLHLVTLGVSGSTIHEPIPARLEVVDLVVELTLHLDLRQLTVVFRRHLVLRGTLGPLPPSHTMCKVGIQSNKG